MHSNFQQNQASRSNLLAKQRKLPKLSTCNLNFKKIMSFRHALPHKRYSFQFWDQSVC